MDAAKKLRREYKTAVADLDTDLWSLLKDEHATIFRIPNWEIYRRATEITREIPTQKIIDKRLQEQVAQIRKLYEDYSWRSKIDDNLNYIKVFSEICRPEEFKKMDENISKMDEYISNLDSKEKADLLNKLERMFRTQE